MKSRLILPICFVFAQEICGKNSLTRQFSDKCDESQKKLNIIMTRIHLLVVGTLSEDVDNQTYS